MPKSAPSAIGGGVTGDEIAGYGKEAGDESAEATGGGATGDEIAGYGKEAGDGAAAEAAEHSKPERMKGGSRKGK